METQTAAHDGDEANIGAAILMRFTDSNSELDLEIRKLIVVLSGVFRGQNAPPTPVGYLHATCSSLDIASCLMLDAHLTILSIVIPKVPAAFLITNLQPVFDSLARPLRSSSSPIERSTGCLVVKCIAQLFIAVANVVNWSDVAELYSFFLGLAYFDNFQVGYQLCLCLPDVLKSFQGTPLFDPATKQITDLLNKYPPLVDYDENASESFCSQQAKALKSLDVVEESLFLLSSEDRTAMLVYFRTLLELNQFPVTARIVGALYRLCLDPSADYSLELLFDLVLSICLSITHHKIMHIPKSTAGLLSIGVTKFYSYNRKISEVNLPIVFDALKVILGNPDEHGDPDPVHAFKCIIDTCIDDRLIKEAVHRVVRDASVGDGIKSELTVIENLCATIQSLLGYHQVHNFPIRCHPSSPLFKRIQAHHNYKIWSLAFEVVSIMFDKLGSYSSCLMRGTLKTLADMQKLPDQIFPVKEKVKLLLKKLVHICGFDATMAAMPQEHMKLLVEINEMASKPVEVIHQVLEATTVRYHLSHNILPSCKISRLMFTLSRSRSSDDQMQETALGPCKNGKRKMDGQGSNGFHDRHSRSIAKREMTKRMSGAAVMAEKLRLEAQ